MAVEIRIRRNRSGDLVYDSDNRLVIEHLHEVRGHPLRWHRADVFHQHDPQAHDICNAVNGWWADPCVPSAEHQKLYQRALIAARFFVRRESEQRFQRVALRQFDDGFAPADIIGPYGQPPVYVQRREASMRRPPRATAPVRPAAGPVPPPPPPPMPSVLTSAAQPILSADPPVECPLPLHSEVRASSRNYHTRRFGVEIEFFGAKRRAVIDALKLRGLQCTWENYTHAVLPHWKLVYDASVSSVGTDSPNGGYELVSPVLKGREGFEELSLALDGLRAAGAKVDNSCGFHAHHEISDFQTDDAIRLVESYADAQRVIDQLVNRTRRSSNYCHAFYSDEVRALRRCCSMSEVERTLPRDRVISFKAYPRQGTVEFRQHQSTLESYEVLSWVRFCQALLEAVRARRAFGSTLEQLLSVLILPDIDRTYFRAKAQRYREAS